MLEFWNAVNHALIANSDEFFAYKTPTDFRIEHRKVELFHTGSEPPKKQPKDEWGKFLRFTSPVESPYPENNLRERALVSGARASCGNLAAAVECRRRQPERAVPDVQRARHLPRCA